MKHYMFNTPNLAIDKHMNLSTVLIYLESDCAWFTVQTGHVGSWLFYRCQLLKKARTVPGARGTSYEI